MRRHLKYIFIIVTMLLGCHVASYGSNDSTAVVMPADSSIAVLTHKDSIKLLKMEKKLAKKKRDWSTWTPNPKRATWLAVFIPGGGQIYNRKYWKLPIFYGGFLGCIYAWRWNNQMYHDYSQAYIDLCDNNPNTDSYNKFLHLGVTIDDTNADRYKSIFKSRKDKYRRWRDLSIFVLIGVYAVSIIDAYVDASLSKFDISDDLSLEIEPAVISNGQSKRLEHSAIGVHGALKF